MHGSAQRDGANDVTFRWIRRARIDAGMRDFVDIPLMEQGELYDIRVLNGSTVVRSWQTSSTTQLYTSAQQVADFGSLQSHYTVEIAQRSALAGPGAVYSAILAVQ